MKKMTADDIIKRMQKEAPHISNVYETSDGKFAGYCNICGGHPIFSRTTAMDSKRRIKKCPVCCGFQIEKGINDIKSQYPEIAKYFVDDDYVTTHSIGTKAKGLTKCPDCGNLRWVCPHKIKTRRFFCPVCDDGLSFPNKFARQLLLQLPLEYLKFEHCPEWTTKIYDNYFVYNTKQYFLEMDGSQHFEDTEWGTYESQRMNDKYKDKLAKSHNITLIRINCSDTSFDSMKENILNSELSHIINLSSVDWNLCNSFATKSLIKTVSEYYEAHPEMTMVEIGEVFHTNRSVIRSYIKKGNELGFCTYNKEVSDKRKCKNLSRANQGRIPKSNIFAYDDDNNYIGHFEYTQECAEYLNNKYKNKRFNRNGIAEVLHGKHKTHQGFHFYLSRKE